jgi:hypothetical protein
MENHNLASFLSGTHLAQQATSSRLVTQFLEKAELNRSEAPRAASRQILGAELSPTSQSSPLLPAALTFLGQVRQDLDSQPQKLLALNHSRKALLLEHLLELSGEWTESTSLNSAAQLDAKLKQWIQGPRSAAQAAALKTYFEEIAWVVLGQALVLKSWSDRALRPWTQKDLGQLNYVLNSVLKTSIPLDREGWLITRQNLYSWYTLPSALQEDLYIALNRHSLQEERPSLLSSLIHMGRNHPLVEAPRYDSKFLSTLWESLETLGIPMREDTGPFKRNRIVFTPTLRDATWTRGTPKHWTWVGLDSNSFRLLIAELSQLFSEPTTPPLWATGLGVEVLGRAQLALLSGTGRATHRQLLSDLEAADLAIVLEERCTRLSDKTPAAHEFRKSIEGTDQLKKIRSHSTSLGAMQAVVALSKLRPGGSLLWLRETPLDQAEGQALLAQILELGKLKGVWNLSLLEHSLPTSPGQVLYPKYLVHIERCNSLTERSSHHPVMIQVGGQVKSHIELPSILAESVRKQAGHRSHWQLSMMQSPSPQQEWATHWPETLAPASAKLLETLRSRSDILGNLASIAALRPGQVHLKNTQGSTGGISGLVISNSFSSDGRLSVGSLERARSEGEAGFVVALPGAAWVAPLKAHLESKIVAEWLAHHAELRSGKRVLSESVLRLLPVPNSLVGVLRGEAPPLSAKWENKLGGLSFEITSVRESLKTLGPSSADSEEVQWIRARALVATCAALEEIESSQAPLSRMMRTDGTPDWREVLKLLPESELVLAVQHPELRVQGRLMSMRVITRIDRVKQSPGPAVRLSDTQTGMVLYLSSQNSDLLDLIESQCEGVANQATWDELSGFLKLPLSLSKLKSYTQEILLAFDEHSSRIESLVELRNACLEV